MSNLFLLSEAQMRRIEPYFPLSHGIARVDDRMVISGIIFVIKNGLRWRDAPREYGLVLSIEQLIFVGDDALLLKQVVVRVFDVGLVAFSAAAKRHIRDILWDA